jgi:hypothetical protein
MRSSVIGLTLAVAVVAQTAVAPAPAVTAATPAATSPVMVAPAATMAPMAPRVIGQPFANPYGARAPMFGARAPYGFFGARGAPMARAPMAQMSPYAMRAPIPMAAPPAPVPAPVVVPTTADGVINVSSHVDDYTNWRLAYLNAQARKSEAFFRSPLLQEGWLFTDGNDRVNNEQRNTLRGQYHQLYLKQNMQAAEYALNIAAQNNAPMSELLEIKKVYDYEVLRQVQQVLNEENQVLVYQIARQDFEWGATSAQNRLASCGNDARACRKAQLDMQSNQFDLMNALSPFFGSGSFSVPGDLADMVSYQRESMSAQTTQETFEAATRTYQANPTAANMFELQIQELKLEKSEARYMSKLANFISPLANLFGGNYRVALRYKEEQMDARIADLQEKLAAEQYKISQEQEPFGRTGNLASEQKTQRAFFNLLTSGMNP